MRRANWARAGLAGMVLLCLAVRADAADAPEIAVEASAREIYIGESVDYLVEIRNVENPAPPDLSALRADFEVVANGEESRNQAAFVFNGTLTQQNSFSHVYRFRLTPKRTGRLVIAAPTATLGGKTVSGSALELNVIAPETQDLVVAEIKTDRVKVYPTQPFEVALRVLVRPLPDEPDRDPLGPLRRQPPHLGVNWLDPPAGLTADGQKGWLESLLAQNGVGFTLNDVTTRSGSFFEGPRLAVFNLHQGRETRKGLDGRPVNYFVYELKRTFTPETNGKYTLGPATVKGSFVDAVEGSRYTGPRLVAVAPAVVVEVREVPVPRPATFCGGIGSYKLSAAASPLALRVGDPLTLTLNIERGPASGSLDLIAPPDLSANPRIAADFEVLDQHPTGRVEGDVKRFEYALRPKRAGAGIPPLVVTVFNPDTEKFSEIATAPTALAVTAASRLGAGDVVGTLPGLGTPEIKSRAEGIFQNVTDPSELSDQSVNVVALAAVAAGVWCGVGVLMAVVSAHRRKSGDVAWQRKRHAQRTAQRKLAEARTLLAAGRSRDALRAVRAALIGLIADTRNIVAEGLTASEADRALADTAIPAAMRAEVLRLLEAIESAEYGSGIASEAATMVDTAGRVLPGLARHLIRNS